MTPSRPTGLLGRFATDRRAVSAVEFALCLPLMLMLYLGGIELSQAVSADRKVTLLARSVGDLVAQNDNVTTTSVGGIFNAASAVLYPFPLTKAGASIVDVKLSEIWTQGNSDGTSTSLLEWSCAATSNLTSPNCSAAAGYSTANCTTDKPDSSPEVTVPAAAAGTATVKAEVTYNWSPTIAYGAIGPITLSQTIYLRPRLSDRVCWRSS